MDFTILAVVILLCGGIPLRNKIYKARKEKKKDSRKNQKNDYKRKMYGEKEFV